MSLSEIRYMVTASWCGTTLLFMWVLLHEEAMITFLEPCWGETRKHIYGGRFRLICPDLRTLFQGLIKQIGCQRSLKNAKSLRSVQLLALPMRIRWVMMPFIISCCVKFNYELTSHLPDDYTRFNDWTQNFRLPDPIFVPIANRIVGMIKGPVAWQNDRCTLILHDANPEEEQKCSKPLMWHVTGWPFTCIKQAAPGCSRVVICDEFIEVVYQKHEHVFACLTCDEQRDRMNLESPADSKRPETHVLHLDFRNYNLRPPDKSISSVHVCACTWHFQYTYMLLMHWYHKNRSESIMIFTWWTSRRTN
jgi:hypothetical protein